jgi:hypothetical protein
MSFEPIRSKMVAEGIAPSAISAFESTFSSLQSGATGMIPESTISPAPDLLKYEDITATPNADLLSQTVVLKLNGGLGTGMGLDKVSKKEEVCSDDVHAYTYTPPLPPPHTNLLLFPPPPQAKSLLKVKGNDTFLDLAAKQVISMRKNYGNVKFMLMNSFSTSDDTMSFLKSNYPSLVEGVEMLQNKVPKLDRETFLPATCPTNPDNEWCPPGHGDLYAALVGSGKVRRRRRQFLGTTAVLSLPHHNPPRSSRSSTPSLPMASSTCPSLIATTLGLPWTSPSSLTSLPPTLPL